MLQLRPWLWLTLGMARITFVEFFFLVPRSGFAMVVRRVPILMLVGGVGGQKVWPGLACGGTARHPILFSMLQRNYQLKLATDGPVAFYSRFPEDV